MSPELQRLMILWLCVCPVLPVLALLLITEPDFHVQASDVLIPTDTLCRQNLRPAYDFRLQSRSLCPWTWVTNVDQNRHPETLQEAKCRCTRALANHNQFTCEEVTVEMIVQRRVIIDENTEEWVEDVFDLAVACVAVPVVERTINKDKNDQYSVDMQHPRVSQDI